MNCELCTCRRGDNLVILPRWTLTVAEGEIIVCLCPEAKRIDYLSIIVIENAVRGFIKKYYQETKV